MYLAFRVPSASGSSCSSPRIPRPRVSSSGQTSTSRRAACPGAPSALLPTSTPSSPTGSAEPTGAFAGSSSAARRADRRGSAGGAAPAAGPARPGIPGDDAPAPRSLGPGPALELLAPLQGDRPAGRDPGRSNRGARPPMPGGRGAPRVVPRAAPGRYRPRPESSREAMRHERARPKAAEPEFEVSDLAAYDALFGEAS